MPTPEHTGTRQYALRVALLYGLLGGVWILFSDQALEWLGDDPRLIVLISAFKGLAFVAVTALALWWLLRRGGGQQVAATDASVVASSHARLPWQPLLIMGLAVLALTVASISLALRQEEARGLAQLRAIADLKARQLQDWLRERADDAELISGSRHLGEDYRRWRDRRDAASGERLRQDLGELVRFTGFHGAQLLDANSKQLFWDAKSSPIALSPALRDAAARARADGRPIPFGPYRDAGDHLRLDFVVPLPPNGDGAVLVLHIDPAATLYPLLQTWPEPSPSGEVVWFRRSGNDVLILNELRHRAGMAATLGLPLGNSRALTAQLLRGEVRSGQAVKGGDYRNVPVFGVMEAVPGGDWYVLAKVDERELYAGAYREAAWVVLAGLLALLALGIGAHLARQRRDLGIAAGVRQAQAERLRALHLLESIADSSTDAIFAKDLEGRYILFNHETARVTGKTAEEALNHDESVLFPPEQAAMLRAHDRRVIAENRVKTYEETVTTAQGERTFLATKGPLRDDAGKVIGIFGVSRDISERMAVEMALRDSEQTYRSLFDNLLNSVARCRMIFENEVPVDYEYLAVNPAFREVTGIQEKVLGRRVSDVLPGYCRDNPESLEIFGRVARSGKPMRWEHYLAALDRWFAFVIYSPAPNEIVIVTENITERKTAELALRERNAELERFNRATVGRELDMIGLKKQVNDLSRQLGLEPPYSLAHLDDSAPLDRGEAA